MAWNKVGEHKTVVFTDSDGFTKVVYHQTPVVSFNHSIIKLNTGGFRSYTTKKRMNQASNQYNLGFGVYQKNYDWFVDINGQTLKMDGETIEFERV